MRRFVIEREIPRVGPFERMPLKAVAALMTWSLRAGDVLLLWLERRRQRRALGALSDHMLKDLGLSRADAGRESGKRFWES